jgi:hypothetical protein
MQSQKSLWHKNNNAIIMNVSAAENIHPIDSN